MDGDAVGWASSLHRRDSAIDWLDPKLSKYLITDPKRLQLYYAKSMGADAETVKSTSDLESAFKRAKKSKVTYVISIKTHSYQWLEGSAYWESPTLEIPKTKENKEALKLHNEGKAKQRQGV